MKTCGLFSLVTAMVLLLTGAAPEQRRNSRGKHGGAEVVPAEVPAYVVNTWLCRPGADTITVSVLASENMEAFVSYGEQAAGLVLRTEPLRLVAGEPRNIVLQNLRPDTAYIYQLLHHRGGEEVVCAELCHFHTQRAPSSGFTFALQADSHLDVSTDIRVYQQTLANVLADKPDFMIDLGDTTMVDKFGSFFTRAESQYRAQRYYLGQIAATVPMLLTLGNHDGEQGSRLTGQPNSMPLWSAGMRKKYFPNPEPGGIYSGNSQPESGTGLLQDYYAWKWGDALFIVLDPFWFTRERKSQDSWDMTLGEAQYRWLAKTLEENRSPFKFVFIHHLVGGLGRDARGGIAIAPYMEWGGRNEDGRDGFAQHRPGWPMPVHSLLAKHGVSIVFHGHDHLFAKEQLDGIIYQEVPQPSHPSGGTRSADEYGYTEGVILGSSGNLRVTVNAHETEVDYVRCSVPGVTRNSSPNGAVEHSYVIKR